MHRKKKRIALGLKFPIEYWDTKKLRVKKEYIYAHDYNNKIESELSKLKSIYLKLHYNDQEITIDRIMDEYENKEQYSDFINFFQHHLEDRYQKEVISYETYRGQNSVLRKLKRYKSNIPFKIINDGFIQEFDTWNKYELRKHARKKHREVIKDGYNMRQGNLKVLRTYLKLAEKEGITFKMPVFKIKWMKSERFSLSKNELKRLIQMFVEQKFNGTAHYTLGCFIFLCSTGLRISDFKKLGDHSINGDFLEFVMQKNKHHFPKDMRIPLNTVSKALFYYIMENQNLRISEQKMNGKLKIIAMEAGLPKGLSLHIARNTFGTLYLENGGNLSTLQTLFGHSSSKTTEIYVRTTEDAKKQEMLNFQKIFTLPEQSFE